MIEKNTEILEKRSASQNYAFESNDEIDLREMFGIIWVEKKLISIITSIAVVLSIIVSLLLTEIYRAEIVLAQADTEQGAAGLMSQLGGAAALLGVNVGSSSGDNVSTAIAVLQSRQFINQFIERNHLLVPLFAANWNKVKQSSEIDNRKYNLESNEWLLSDGQPTEQDAYLKFRNALVINGPDRNTGIVSVVLNWYNPKEAAEWLNELIRDLNQELRTRDVKEASNAINYLRKQLESTQLVDMQQIFYQLIESQTRITMLADVREEYVFRVIDPAVVPEKKSEPRRSLIVIVGTLAGGILGLLIVWLRRIFR